MGRPAKVIEDETDLAGDRVDVGARLGWLLRTWREHRGIAMKAMAAHLTAEGCSVTQSTLSRIEQGAWRRDDIMDGYETMLNIVPGSLRGAAASLCRTFDYGPVNETPAVPAREALPRFDRAVEAVLGADKVNGRQWLDFALIHEHTPFGLTTAQITEPLERLIDELARGVGAGFAARYEALTIMRCGKYHRLISDLGKAYLDHPNVQCGGDVGATLSERPSPNLLHWAARRMVHPNRATAMAAYAIITTTANSIPWSSWPATAWQPVAQHWVTDYAAAAGRHRERLVLIYHCLPTELRRQIADQVPEPIPRRTPSSWEVNRTNSDWLEAGRLADSIVAERGGPQQPLLQRLLFEMLFDHRANRSYAAGMSLRASPYAEIASPLLIDMAVNHPEASVRDRAGGAVLGVVAGTPDLGAWLEHPDKDHQALAQMTAGLVGIVLPIERMSAAIQDPELRRSAVWAAGMTAHPLLHEWLARPPSALGPEELGAAQWWLDHGPRVAD